MAAHAEGQVAGQVVDLVVGIGGLIHQLGGVQGEGDGEGGGVRHSVKGLAVGIHLGQGPGALQLGHIAAVKQLGDGGAGVGGGGGLFGFRGGLGGGCLRGRGLRRRSPGGGGLIGGAAAGRQGQQHGARQEQARQFLHG